MMKTTLKYSLLTLALGAMASVALAQGLPAGPKVTVSAVTSAYRQVDPKCREVIKSYCVEDMTLAETADRSGYSPKTVWKRIQECLKKMRACLS